MTSNQATDKKLTAALSEYNGADSLSKPTAKSAANTKATKSTTRKKTAKPKSTKQAAKDAVEKTAKTASRRAMSATEDAAAAAIATTRSQIEDAATTGLDTTERLVSSISRAAKAAGSSLQEDGMHRTASYVNAAAQGFDRAAAEVDSVDASNISSRVESFVRQNPMMTMGVLAIAGFALAGAVNKQNKN